MVMSCFMQHWTEAYSQVPEISVRPHPTEAPSHISQMPGPEVYLTVKTI